MPVTHLSVLCSVSLSNTVYQKTENHAASVFIPICAGCRAGMEINMKYLLVAPSLKPYADLQEYCMPMGIAYINGAMRKAGFDVDAMNMLFEKDPIAALKRRIIEGGIDVLMCGGLTSEYQNIKTLYIAAREARPDITIIGGGGGFSSEPIIFSELTQVDYAVIGEGEETNCELAFALEHGRDVSDIPGIVYRDQSGYHMTPPRADIRDVDSIPFPSYDGLDMDKYLDCQHVDGWYNYYAYYSDTPRLMPMLLARSCPYQCAFCYHPIGKGYRARSLDNFFAELDLWIDRYHINGIALIDECFSVDQERVLEFCKRIKPYDLKWACQMRADTYTEDILSAMKDSGCIGACFGIESMSQRVLDNMNKHMLVDTIERALALTYKYRIGCNGNLIFGAEAENFETMAESLAWHDAHCLKYRNRPVRHFAYVQTYPGSAYYDRACRNGKIASRADYIRKSDWNLNITEGSQDDYETMGDLICVCRMENYNRGEIIDIQYTGEDTVKFTFRCAWCGSVNQYRNMNRLRFSKGKIRELGCRACNILGEYILDEEAYPYDSYIAIPWLLGRIDVKLTPSFFAERGIKRIALCGKNAYARKLIECVRDSDEVEIRFVYDVIHTERQGFDGIRQLSGEDAFPEVDLIINADLPHQSRLRKMIGQRSDAEVVSLESLLRYILGMDTSGDKHFRWKTEA